MGRPSQIVAHLPSVKAAVGNAAGDFARVVRTVSAPHGDILRRVEHTSINAVDYSVWYSARDPKGRGYAVSVELGHINVPAGGKWTPGIHIFRRAIALARVF